MLFLVRAKITRAHHPAVGMAPAALADPHAPQSCFREAVVFGIRKQPFHLSRPVGWSDAQIARDGIRIEHLAGIHALARVPDGAELALSTHQIGAVHFLQQRGAAFAIAMLAGQRAAILHHEIGGLLEKALPVREALFGVQLEVNPAMHQAVAEMSVYGCFVAMLVEKRHQLAKIVA